MRKHTITALAAALCLLCTGLPATGIAGEVTSISASAADDETIVDGALTYTIVNGCLTVSAFDGSTETVVIPAEVNGMPVTSIGKSCFYDGKITSITIPEGVTTIEAGAFRHCKSLTEVSLPSTLTSIESNAFNDCQTLENLTIPESVTSIGATVFNDTAWIAAQKEQSPFVIVNGILIDASAAVTNIREEVKAARTKAAEDAAELAEIRSPGKRVRIITNQVGYFPELVKRATLVNDASEPLSFELLNENDEVVFSGMSSPFGSDDASGDFVHILDFSAYNTVGTYTLKAETGETSRAFKIGILDTYSGLMYDALNYFYQNRSGIAIESQYITSGDAEALARGVAHNPDIATIQQVWGYEGSSGEQDVTGGWYDAGDHGKYVVNGGITLWLMQNQYERALSKGKTDAYADGAMKIPENNNGMPDLLDEARYEMEWMLTMRVQDGDYKDMAYHKIHDSKWTGLGLDPAKDVMDRYLLPPSTAATLNLAACGAQAYRLWKDLDPDFANTCLEAAKASYAAAKLHPDVLAPNKEHGGGGAYSDSNVSDEFYWAACELFTSTGDEAYYEDLKASDYAFRIQRNIQDDDSDSTSGVFDWGSTAALGSLTLLLHPDTVAKEEISALRTSLTETADLYLDFSNNQGYGTTYGGYVNEDGYRSYVWGSNSFVVDNAIILAYANDESGDGKYLPGIVSAMDYVLGRNALDFSYVTGYGEHSAQYPHHRYWAVQSYPDYPKAPCGVLTGGPNSDISDPAIAKTDMEAGVTPAQLCYIDDSAAYSVNECAINWNSPLAWVTGYLCEQNGGIIAGQESGGQQLAQPLLPSDIPNPIIEITVPDGVTAIGEQIFGQESGYVHGVILPDSVTVINKEAFYRCSGLEELNIPEGIETVGDRAFGDTPWLESKLEDTPMLILNNILIDGTSVSGDVVIPDGVTSVLGSAFKLNENITSVVIPEGVERIGPSAFQNCSALTAVTLPESLKTIEADAFAGTALEELTIPAGVQSIGNEAFINCTSLPEVTLTNRNVLIGTEAFGCTSTFTANGQYSYIFVHRVLEDFVVNCYEGSTADKFATATGLKTNYLAGEALMLGDLNDDKAINASDAALILIAAANIGANNESGLTPEQTTAGDVNKDEAVNASDAALVLQYAASVGAGSKATLEEYLQGNE